MQIKHLTGSFVLWVGLIFSGHSYSSELVFHLFPTNSKLDWSTPKKLTISAAISYSSPGGHGIGHANVILNCTDIDRPFSIYSGMTGASMDEVFDILLSKQIGLGLLMYSFKGHLETKEEVLKQIDQGRKSGKMTIMKFDISSENCLRMAKYYNEYKQNNYGKSYGLINRPLYGEGAGCGTYVLSYLEVGGFLTSQFTDLFLRDLRLPRELVGMPWTETRAPLSKIIFPKDRSRWAKGHEPHFGISFVDPEKMYRFAMGEETDKVYQSLGLAYEFFEEEGIRGVRFDAEHVPAPSTPIWKFY